MSAAAFARFSAFLAEKEPTVEKTFVLMDGFQFAASEFGEKSLIIARFDDEEPYAFGLLQKDSNRFAEYGEGDVTIWTFTDEGDAEEAARIYGQDDSHWAAEYVAAKRHEVEDEALGEAIVEWIHDYSVGPVDETTVDAALEKYRGPFDDDAGYAESILGEYADEIASGIPEPVQDVLMVKVDWEDTALAMNNTLGWVFFRYRGHYFEAAD